MFYRNKQNPEKPWMGQITLRGRLKRKSFLTKKEAIRWEVEQNKRKFYTTDTVSLGEWAVRYLDYSANRHAGKTYLEEKVPALKRLFADTKLRKED